MATSRRSRTRYSGSQRSGDFPIACAAWYPSFPNSRQEDLAYVISGKVTDESDTASTGSLELFHYDYKDGDLESAHIHDVDEGQLLQSIAIHPKGGGAVCSFSSDCKLYNLGKSSGLQLKVSDQDLAPLKDIGPQMAMIFSTDGSRLATGGKDGHLRVFEWPSLTLLFDHPDGYGLLKSIDISLDGAFLAAIPATGKYCHVWDIEKSTIITTIHNSNKNELFGLCKFSKDGTKPFLFLTITRGGEGSGIGVWDMEAWNKLGIKTFSRDPITSFATSHDGKWLAIGDTAGVIRLIEVKKMQISQTTTDAHTSKVTLLDFSPDGRVLLSSSIDSPLSVTKRNLDKEWKEWQIYVLLLSLIVGSAILFYVFFQHSDSFWNFPLGRDQPARPPPDAIYGHVTDFDGGEFM